MNVREIVRANNAFYCMDCGKCTSVCPVSSQHLDFSPRRAVTSTLSGAASGVLPVEDLSLCLTCGRCANVCPARVDYLGFTQGMRCAMAQEGEHIVCSHGGIMQNLMRLMASGCDGQAMRRLDWVPEGAKTAASGELLYFTGCLPFYDAYFTHLDMDTLKIARDTLRILNALGETPVLLAGELCCGHDLYWSGDEANAARLARKNLAAIAASGAKRIVTACPECAYTLRELYPRLTGNTAPYVVQHIAEFLAEKQDAGALKLSKRSGRIVYHDSCRLSRQLGVTDQPRRALRAVYGDGLKEMEHSGPDAVCCGTNGWLHCHSVSRRLQDSRLKEAATAGAKTLVTACPKCQIHLRCAQAGGKDETLKRLKVTDLVSVVAEAIDGG